MGKTFLKVLPFLFLALALLSLYFQVETWKASRHECTCGEEHDDDSAGALLGRINY
ncbi:MAG: hypothetical protein AAFY48_25425 [Bacteroidota bacterium]